MVVQSLAQKQHDDGQANADRAQRQQSDAAVSQQPPGTQVHQFTPVRCGLLLLPRDAKGLIGFCEFRASGGFLGGELVGNGIAFEDLLRQYAGPAFKIDVVGKKTRLFRTEPFQFLGKLLTRGSQSSQA